MLPAYEPEPKEFERERQTLNQESGPAAVGAVEVVPGLERGPECSASAAAAEAAAVEAVEAPGATEAGVGCWEL
jgi:hypothetical protein